MTFAWFILGLGIGLALPYAIDELKEFIHNKNNSNNDTEN